jgi:hypothetical protein
MEYEHFSVIAFERQPNKWRARIRRADGMPVVIQGFKKWEEFWTGIDWETAQAALMMAIVAIDAGTFKRSRDQVSVGREQGRSRHRRLTSTE